MKREVLPDGKRIDSASAGRAMISENELEGKISVIRRGMDKHFLREETTGHPITMVRRRGITLIELKGRKNITRTDD